jgi:cob(I)alamin adenosyltransferase
MDNYGYIHIYTGDGKGKTTASLGICLRTLALGGRVFYAQFIKGEASGEFKILKNENTFTHELFGSGRFIRKNPPPVEEVNRAKAGLEKCADALSSGKYDLVVLDEVNGAIRAGILSVDDLLSVLKKRNSRTEVILTGRNCDPQLIEYADLVSEIKCVKHYFDEQGVPARKGIEF